MNLSKRVFATFHVLSCLLLVALTISSCEIQGGVAEAPPQPSNVPLPLATDVGAATAIQQRLDTWTIALLEAPRDFYPYQPTSPLQRAAAPITELLFPAPVLVHNYGYTTTGVLEQLPTFENGGVLRQKAEVFLDAAGNITTTATQVITEVDQLIVTYRWNPKLMWSDGVAVTADDSVFAYELARRDPPNDEARERLNQTLRYEKVDQHTTRAVLKPDLIGATYVQSYWLPLPRHLLASLPPERVRQSDFVRQPVGYGPYQIVQRTTSTIRLERNPYFFGTPPDVERVEIAFFNDLELVRANLLNGNLDVAFTDRLNPTLLPQFEQDATSNQLQVEYVRNPIWEHIDFNLDVRKFQDIRVRRAIALAINRQQMARTLLGPAGQPLNSWIMPEEPEAAKLDEITLYPYNPDEARRLLDEAGWQLPEGEDIRFSSDGITLTLQLMTTADNPLRSAIAEQITTDLAAVGMQVDVLEVPTSEMFDPSGPLFLRQFEAALFGWGAGPEPGGLSLWSCAAVPTPENRYTGENFAGWCFLNADRAIRRAVTSLDAEERREAYVQQQKLWTQEVPAIPLFQRVSVAMVGPRIRGVQPDTFAPITWNIAAWERAP
jgi:peptide/nickel transport system substrate-binding protein